MPDIIVQTKIEKWLRYSGTKEYPRIWIGTRIFLATLVGLIFALIPFSIVPIINLFFETEIFIAPSFLPTASLISFIVGAIFTLLIAYLHIAYIIDNRRRMVENILPDFLYLVGNNLKSGMSPFYAFRSAIRPEFGPLSEEVELATKKSLGIGSFADSLSEMSNRIDSKVLNDTIKFFVHAMKSGGKLALLIETSANDIKQTNQLKKELITATKMYVLFITFVVVLASPSLLAVSVQFLHILENIQAQSSFATVPSNVSAQIGFSSSSVGITPEFMQNMSYIIIISNAILASIFIGVIGGGKIRQGLKYAPMLIILGIIIFNFVLGIVGNLVGA